MKLVSSLDELRLEFADAVVDSDGWFATALDLMFAAECLERPPRCPPSRAPTSAARPVPRLFCSGRRGTLPQPARSPIPCLPPLAGRVPDRVNKIPPDSGGGNSGRPRASTNGGSASRRGVSDQGRHRAG